MTVERSRSDLEGIDSPKARLVVHARRNRLVDLAKSSPLHRQAIISAALDLLDEDNPIMVARMRQAIAAGRDRRAMAEESRELCTCRRRRMHWWSKHPNAHARGCYYHDRGE